MRKHNFELGQWVTCESVYMQVMALRGVYVLECRFADRSGHWAEEHLAGRV